jgi:NADPH:quinone reductase-like Zn-dependent oxidoreductase
LRWLLRLAKASLMSLFTRQKLKMFIVSPNRADLLSLKELVEAGKAKPVIERHYALSEAADALRHVGRGHTRGQVVIRVVSE